MNRGEEQEKESERLKEERKARALKAIQDYYESQQGKKKKVDVTVER